MSLQFEVEAGVTPLDHHINKLAAEHACLGDKEARQLRATLDRVRELTTSLSAIYRGNGVVDSVLGLIEATIAEGSR